MSEEKTIKRTFVFDNASFDAECANGFGCKTMRLIDETAGIDRISTIAPDGHETVKIKIIKPEMFVARPVFYYTPRKVMDIGQFYCYNCTRRIK